MSAYIVKRLPDDIGAYDFKGAFKPLRISPDYRPLNAAKIALYPWRARGGYKCESRARVGWNAQGLVVLMYACESEIACAETRVGGRQCADSCLEFFVNPFPDTDKRYINIEMNPNAIPHIGIGEGRGVRVVPSEVPDGMHPTHSAHEGAWWAVSYVIPTQMLEAVYGRALYSKQIMRGNFYKCDENLHPHFGTWNPVTAPKPDFHRPEYFGELILE